MLSEVLADQGFDSTNPLAFGHWKKVAIGAAAALCDLASRSRNMYEARVFLNGPTLDSSLPLPFADLVNVSTGTPIRVSIGQASDDVLGPLAWQQGWHPSIHLINTVLRYETEVSVAEDEPAYLAKYLEASEVAALALGALRLLRPRDDIGVLAIELVPAQPFTPRIRPTWNERFNHERAPSQARRFVFDLKNFEPLSEEEVREAGEIVGSLAERTEVVPGLKLALRRFADAVERYEPDDRERLLEYGIALEAIYLNDSHEKIELSYRLRLRLARFLASEASERANLFDQVKNLYDFRSRIAHGGSFDDLTPKEQERLDQAMKAAPDLVARSIRTILDLPEDKLPKSTKHSLWRDLELGAEIAAPTGPE